MPVLSKTKFKLPPCILFFHVTETLPVLWKNSSKPQHENKENPYYKSKNNFKYLNKKD